MRLIPDTVGTNHKGTKTRSGVSSCLRVFVVLVELIAICPLLVNVGETQNELPSWRYNLHQWGAVTLFHGLPSDHVRAITQDSDGVMWFGTDGGLAKYDGRRVQRISGDGPAAARVLALKIDDNGVLWIGTEAGAARFINGEIKPITETGKSVITAIITPGRGRAVMTSEQGEVFDCSTALDGSISIQTIKPQDHPLLTIERRAGAPVQLTSLALIGDTLIVGTRSRGLLSIGRSETKAGAAEDVVKEILSRPRAFFVEAIESDARGHLWFGAQTSADDSGLFESGDLMRPEKISAGLGTVTTLRQDPRENLWVGTEARGVFIYRDGRRLEHFTFENTAGGLRSNHVYSIFIDREGVAWFGTDRGACRFDPHSLRVEAVSSDAESNFARTLFQSSNGTLWCGTNKGLFERSNDSTWQEVLEMKGRVIHTIAEDSQGRLLIGSASGLFVCAKSKRPGAKAIPSGDGREFSRIESADGTTDNIRAIEAFQGATYIANFGRGVERLDAARRLLVWPDDSADPRQRQVVSLHAEKDQRLCIGTADAGVFFFDDKQTKTDPALDELIGGSVWSFQGASDDALWLATARGLYVLQSGKLIRAIENVDARTVVASSSSSSQRAVWCATVGSGLYKVLMEGDASASEPAASIITSKIDSEEGLPSQNVFAVVPSRSGDETLWIGTSRGVARYEPAGSPPVLSVTRAMGKRAYSTEELRTGLNLEYPQNSLALDVAAMSSRTFPEQFQYAFSVLDSSGHVVSKKVSREAQLLIQNLRPGRYRVEARAFTRDLVPSDPLRFEFAVGSAPFPWASTALSVLLALALFAMWWGYRQNKRLTRTNVTLAETRIQLANETEAERRRIARDLHDQTLADLRRLMMLADELPAPERANGHVKPEVFRAEVESISTEIRRICEDLSPSALANVGLAAALEWALVDAVAHQPAEEKFEYEFVCDAGIEEKLRLEPAAQIQIYRIVQEALSNICRHSSATRVRLAITETNGDLVIELEDNGRGFDANKPGKAGRGLANIRSRASLIEARVNWTERAAGGISFTLRKAAAAGREQSRLTNPASTR